MNKHLKELAQRSSIMFESTKQNRIHSVSTETLEKFAELIVKECIEVIEKQKAKMSYGPTFVIEDIKQHFGVEE